MHFATQQTSRVASQFSAQRLDQLPPEALAGLSADELSAIQNFAVPANSASTLAALPPINGSISGTNLTQAATVPIAADGTYSIAGVPSGSYTLVATLPNSEGSALTATTTANVILDQTTTADITFAPTGGVTGTVLRTSGAVVVN